MNNEFNNYRMTEQPENDAEARRELTFQWVLKIAMACMACGAIIAMMFVLM